MSFRSGKNGLSDSSDSDLDPVRLFRGGGSDRRVSGGMMGATESWEERGEEGRVSDTRWRWPENTRLMKDQEEETSLAGDFRLFRIRVESGLGGVVVKTKQPTWRRRRKKVVRYEEKLLEAINGGFFG